MKQDVNKLMTENKKLPITIDEDQTCKEISRRPHLGKRAIFKVSELCHALDIEVPKDLETLSHEYISKTELFKKLENSKALLFRIENKAFSNERLEKLKKTARKFKERYVKIANLEQTDEGLLFAFINWRYVFAPMGFGWNNYFGYDLNKKSIKEANEFANESYRDVVFEICTISGYQKYCINKALFNKKFHQYVKREYLKVKTATFDEFSHFVDKHPTFFGKPAAGTGGKDAGLMTVEGHKEALFNKLREEKYMIEEVLQQHSEIAKFNPETLNTLRVYTLLTIDHHPIIIYAGIRFGRRGLSVDNVGRGGLTGKIDLQTGQIVGNAVDKFRNEFTVHPDSKVLFDGFEIPSWEKVVSAVKESALAMPYIRHIGWDLTVTLSGEIEFIEGNSRPNFNMMQTVDQMGKKHLYEKHVRALANNDWKDLLIEEDDIKNNNLLTEFSKRRPLNMISVGYMRRTKERKTWMDTASAFALMHGIELFHFTMDQIDFENQSILGEFWDVEKGCFIKKKTPFPHIIQDNRFETPLKLRKKLIESGVILTWVNLGGKLKVDRILRESPVKKYLIDTFNYNDINLLDVLEQYQEVIIKPFNSSLGKGVYKLSKSNDHYIIHTAHERKEISHQDLLEYDKMFKEKRHIVQEYVDSRTLVGHPFDIKVYLIRSGKDGSWNHLNLLPRLGAASGVVSNVGAGGNAFLFPDKFLEGEFGEDWLDIQKEMQELMEIVPAALQKGYERTLNSLGLDIGIDRRTNQLKLFEVNGTINATPYKMEMCVEQMHLYKQLYKESQTKTKQTKHEVKNDYAFKKRCEINLDADETYGRISKYTGKRKVFHVPHTIKDVPVKVIEEKAFKNCKTLKEIILPPSIRSIADDAFENCTELTVIGKKGSYIQAYTQKNGLKFMTYEQYKLLGLKRKIKRKIKHIRSLLMRST